MICPVCGSLEVKTTYKTKALAAPYGPPVDTRIRVDSCLTCQEWGDFEMTNDPFIEASLLASTIASVPLMLQKLQTEHGYSRTYIERVANLPFGSLTRFEAGQQSQDGPFNIATVIVLRMICTYPPILPMLDKVRGQ